MMTPPSEKDSEYAASQSRAFTDDSERCGAIPMKCLSGLSLRRFFVYLQSEAARKAARKAIYEFFPIVGTLKAYRTNQIVGDLAAGLAVAVAAVPMGMSYSLLAGVPPAHGLYCNLFFPLVYMFLGTARQNALGTSAIEAMLSAEAVANVVGRNAPPDLWLNAMIGLCFCVGIVMIGMRLLRLGMVVGFLADPVLGGFTTGSALVIATSQLHHIFGLNFRPVGASPEVWWQIAMNLGDVNWYCFLLGVVGVALLMAAKYVNERWFPRIPLPGSLLMIIVSVAIGFSFHVDRAPLNIAVVGVVPKGIPLPSLPSLGHRVFGRLLFEALWYSVVYYCIHISVAKRIAVLKGYTIDADQELFAIGCLSIFGGFFQCFPAATSLSRTSIACCSGAETVLFNLLNVALVALTITLLTPMLHYLPMTSLAAVVLYAVYWLIDFREVYMLFKLRNLVDVILWIVSFLTTFCFGPLEGLVASVALSLLWLLKKNARPHIAVLGRLPNTTVYRDISRFPMAKELKGIKIFRFDASLDFSNCDYFQSKIISLLQQSDCPRSEESTSTTLDQNGVKGSRFLCNKCQDTEAAGQSKKDSDLSNKKVKCCLCPNHLETMNKEEFIRQHQYCLDCAPRFQSEMMNQSIDSPVHHKKINHSSLQERQDWLEEENNYREVSTSFTSLVMPSSDAYPRYVTPRSSSVRASSNFGLEKAYGSIERQSSRNIAEPYYLSKVEEEKESFNNSSEVRFRWGSYHRDADIKRSYSEQERKFSDPIIETLDPVKTKEENLKWTNEVIKICIIDASSINDMDVTSIRMIKTFAATMLKKECVLLFANWKGSMRDFLERASFHEIVPPDNCFLSLHDAVIWAEAFYVKKQSSLYYHHHCINIICCSQCCQRRTTDPCKSEYQEISENLIKVPYSSTKILDIANQTTLSNNNNKLTKNDSEEFPLDVQLSMNSLENHNNNNRNVITPSMEKSACKKKFASTFPSQQQAVHECGAFNQDTGRSPACFFKSSDVPCEGSTGWRIVSTETASFLQRMDQHHFLKDCV